jgi:hypothetical protein
MLPFLIPWLTALLGVVMPQAVKALDLIYPNASVTEWNIAEPMPVIWHYEPATDPPYITLNIKFNATGADHLAPGDYIFPGVNGVPPFHLNWTAIDYFRPGWHVQVNIWNPWTNVSVSSSGSILLVDSNGPANVAPSGTTTITLTTSFTATTTSTSVAEGMPASTTVASEPASLIASFNAWLSTQTQYNTSTWAPDMVPMSLLSQFSSTFAAAPPVATLNSSNIVLTLPGGTIPVTGGTSIAFSVITDAPPAAPTSTAPEAPPSESAPAPGPVESSAAPAPVPSEPTPVNPSAAPSVDAQSTSTDLGSESPLPPGPKFSSGDTPPGSTPLSTSTTYSIITPTGGSTTRHATSSTTTSTSTTNAGAALAAWDFIEGLLVTALVVWLITFC